MEILLVVAFGLFIWLMVRSAKNGYKAGKKIKNKWKEW